MGQPFDWDLIRSFLAVARAGKLTTGAKLLRIDHSTLSRRISALEKSLGAKLFDHSVSGYSLIFFFNDTAARAVFTLSLHDDLPPPSRQGEKATALEDKGPE